MIQFRELIKIPLTKKKKFLKFTFTQSETGLMRFPQEKHLVKAYIIQAFAKLFRVHAFIRHANKLAIPVKRPDTPTYHPNKLFSSISDLLPNTHPRLVI